MEPSVPWWWLALRPRSAERFGPTQFRHCSPVKERAFGVLQYNRERHGCGFNIWHRMRRPLGSNGCGFSVFGVAAALNMTRSVSKACIRDEAGGTSLWWFLPAYFCGCRSVRKPYSLGVLLPTTEDFCDFFDFRFSILLFDFVVLAFQILHLDHVFNTSTGL